MKLTSKQYAQIKDALPVQRENVKINNEDVLNAILYVAEDGSKWRALSERFATGIHCINA